MGDLVKVEDGCDLDVSLLSADLRMLFASNVQMNTASLIIDSWHCGVDSGEILKLPRRSSCCRR